MGDVYDIVVIGAGIEGSSAAYQGVKAGKKVLLLEQSCLCMLDHVDLQDNDVHEQQTTIQYNDPPALHEFALPHSRGSSHGGTRIIMLASPARHREKMLEVCYPMWEELEKETNTEILRKIGVLNFCEDWAEAIPKAMLESMKRSGAGLEQLSIEERIRRFPNISYPTKPVSYLYQKGGYIRANKALQCYQNEFSKRGGVLQDDEKMLDIVPGVMVTVKTNRSEYRTRSVILAPGPWASTVLKQLGLNIPLKLDRGHHTFWSEKEPGMYANMPIYADHGLHIFEASGWPSVEYPGMMKVSRWAPTPIESPEDRDFVSSESEILQSRAHVKEHFPGLDAENGPAIAEACIVTSTPDNDFVIDLHPNHHNIVIGCGFSGHGFMMAPIIGRLLTQLALGAKPELDISPLKINRF